MKRRILVLEDNVLLSKSIKRHLERERDDVEVTAVGGCEEARRALEGEACDLIVSDVQLRDGIGLDLIEELSLVRDRPPVLLITGEERHAWERRALELGIEAYLVKPFPMLTLSRIVGCLLEDHCCFPDCSRDYEAFHGPENCPLNLQ